MRVVGVDIGGTNVQVGLFDEMGEVYRVLEYETNQARGGQYMIKQLIEQITILGPVDAIGVSVAGQVERDSGILIDAVNISNTNQLPIKAILQHHFHVPVIIENDVNAAALGELHFGKKLEDFLYVSYGTGIGAAIIRQRTLFTGKDGFAGEVGHMVTHAGGRLCKCGLMGCYEMYGSTRALVHEAKKLSPAYTNGKSIFTAYHKGNEQIKSIVFQWIDDLVVGLISLVHIFNPTTLVVGGSVMQQGMLADMIEQRLNAQLIPSFRPVPVFATNLGNKSGMLGVISLLT